MHAAACQAYRSASWDAAIASRAAKAANSEATGRRRCHGGDSDDKGDASVERSARAERRHPLVAAMTEALRSLMPADGAASDTDGTELRDRAQAFAHELVNALRDSGGGRPRSHGYGDGHLAQRLERLAGQLEKPAPAAQTSAATSLSASLTTTSLNVSIAADGTASASLSVTSIELDVAKQTSQSTEAAESESPLLAAFRRLMKALQPGSTGTADGTQLGAFLRQLAGALRGDHGASDTSDAAASGSLVSLAA